MKRVRTALWIIPVSNLAGVARHTIDVARVGLPGWRQVVLAPEGPLLDELRTLGCPVIAAPIDELPVPQAIWAVRNVIKRVRPDVVHSHLAKADILAALAQPGLPVKLVTTEHHIPENRFQFHKTRFRASVMECVHHFRLMRFSQAIAVSDSTRRDMRKWWKTKTPITVILNAVDRIPDRPTPKPGLRLLSLCRLSPEKNVEASIRAFAHIAAEHPAATLTVAGSGPESDSLQALARELGVFDRVSFPGHVEPIGALTSHDVILQPSKSDNLSYTLLDALAYGMGIAASPIGGNPEMLPQRCIADADDVLSLAQIAVVQGLEVDQRPSLGDNIPTVERMAQQIVLIYQKALN